MPDSLQPARHRPGTRDFSDSFGNPPRRRPLGRASLLNRTIPVRRPPHAEEAGLPPLSGLGPSGVGAFLGLSPQAIDGRAYGARGVGRRGFEATLPSRAPLFSRRRCEQLVAGGSRASAHHRSTSPSPGRTLEGCRQIGPLGGLHPSRGAIGKKWTPAPVVSLRSTTGYRLEAPPALAGSNGEAGCQEPTVTESVPHTAATEGGRFKGDRRGGRIGSRRGHHVAHEPASAGFCFS